MFELTNHVNCNPYTCVCPDHICAFPLMMIRHYGNKNIEFLHYILVLMTKITYKKYQIYQNEMHFRDQINNVCIILLQYLQIYRWISKLAYFICRNYLHF